MVATAAPARTLILDRLNEVSDLRPFPAAATRLVSACQSAETSSKHLAEIIQCDAALATRLLRLANSSMYGCSSQIRTIDHAVVVLGYRAVRNLALSVAGATVFAHGTEAQNEQERLWEHSLGCAAVARLLARHVPGMLPDEAFLAGIFHDVGKLVFYDLACDEYTALTEQMAYEPNSAAVVTEVAHEMQAFGATHTQLGQSCGENWGLTDEINHAIGFHHDPEDTPEYFELVALTHAADCLSKAWQIGTQEEFLDTESMSMADILGELGINEATVTHVRTEAENAFAELLQTCVL